jgi:hypothetical protein
VQTAAGRWIATPAAAPPPPDIPNAVESQSGLDGWPEIEEDPGPFLALGLCSSARALGIPPPA